MHVLTDPARGYIGLSDHYVDRVQDGGLFTINMRVGEGRGRLSHTLRIIFELVMDPVAMAKLISK